MLLSAALGCLFVVVSAPSGGDLAVEPGEDRTRVLDVLRIWDRARAQAWRRADPEALAALYTPGSRSGRADRALLAAYAERGLRVTGMRMQVADLDVVSASADRIELLVTDRLVGAVVVGRRTRLALPHDGWSRRRLVLRRGPQAWRVVEVADQPRSASTDSTSGSMNS